MIQVQCHCGKKMQVQDEHAGRQVHCPECRARVQVPRQSQQSNYVEPIAAAPSLPTAPARPRRRQSEAQQGFGPPPGMKRKPNTVLIVSIAGGAFFLLVAIIVVVFLLLDAGEDEQGRQFVSRGDVTYSRNNLMQMGIAMHAHNDVHKHLPPAATFDANGKPLLSWRVHILPYVEQNNLYRRFRLDEPWNSPHNIQLLKQMPNLYKMPGIETDPTKTHYQVFLGPNTVFGPMRKEMRMPGFGFGKSSVFCSRISSIPRSFRDGTSNTILIVEAHKPVPWSAPQDLQFDPKKPMAGVGAVANGFHIAIGDGSVRFVPYGQIGDQTMRAAVTPAGSEKLGPDW